MKFLGRETRCVSLEKKKNLFSRGVKSKPLPSCMSKAFSQYQCPLLTLFNIESILEIIHVVLGQDSWLLCKGELSNHIWATLWDRIGCNYNQDGLAPGICLNLAEQWSRPNWQLSSWARRDLTRVSVTHQAHEERALALWSNSLFVWALQAVPGGDGPWKGPTLDWTWDRDSIFYYYVPAPRTVSEIRQMPRVQRQQTNKQNPKPPKVLPKLMDGI